MMNGLHTSVLPKVPAACMRSMGAETSRLFCFSLDDAVSGAGGGLLMKVSWSNEGSSSERASRSHEDL